MNGTFVLVKDRGNEWKNAQIEGACDELRKDPEHAHDVGATIVVMTAITYLRLVMHPLLGLQAGCARHSVIRVVFSSSEFGCCTWSERAQGAFLVASICESSALLNLARGKRKHKSTSPRPRDFLRIEHTRSHDGNAEKGKTSGMEAHS